MSPFPHSTVRSFPAPLRYIALLASAATLSCGPSRQTTKTPAPGEPHSSSIESQQGQSAHAVTPEAKLQQSPMAQTQHTSPKARPTARQNLARPTHEGTSAQRPIQAAPPRPLPNLSPAQVAQALARLRNGSSQVHATVPSYRIARGLRNVTNRADFAKELSRPQKRLLASQGFLAVRSSKFSQLYEIYEANDYGRPHRYPSFITTDTALHAYHLLFDSALAEVETHGLFRQAVEMSRALVRWSLAQASKAHHPMVRRALTRNAAFFAVADQLLTGRKAPAGLQTLVQHDIARIMLHSGTEVSAVVGTKVDFTMFIPRGHYTKSTKLKRYFRALMWYGLASMPLSLTGKNATLATIQALLMTRGLKQARAGKHSALDLWSAIYDVTRKFVGPADDLTPLDYRRVMDPIWPADAAPDSFADQGKLAAFVKAASSLPQPRIRQFFRDRPQSEQGRKFRLMGQRFVYDSRIMQKLVLPQVPGRPFPSALDVPAAFGFHRAEVRALRTMSARLRPSYRKALAQIRKETAQLGPEEWHSNLYFELLHTLAATLMDVPAGYPPFMRHPNWKDRILLSFMGPWTELRHDTILYAKPSGAECGGDDEELALPKGYVEPNMELWTRLGRLARTTNTVLRPYRMRGQVGEIRRGFRILAKWADFCAAISRKELTGGQITKQEYEKMTLFGGDMADLHRASVTQGDFNMLTQKEYHMALVADVHSSSGTVLEEAVGGPAILYVIVPLGRTLQIARGAIFTHYQFTRPASKRMTDDQWKSQVIRGKLPHTWPWLKSLMTRQPKRSKVVSRVPEC